MGAATDPIQQMFADKVKEYAKKKAAAGGKLPDATKETEAAIAMELEKVAQAYGGGAGVDMSKFLTLNSSTLWWMTFHSSKQVIKKCRYKDTKLKNHQIHNCYYTVNIHSFLKFNVIVVSVI